MNIRVVSPWAFQNVSSQSSLACQDCHSECCLRPEWWRWCRFLSRSTPYNTVLCVPRLTLHLMEKSSIVSARWFQSSNRSRKYAASKRENDVFVRQITSTNQNTLDEHCVALVPTFSSLQTTMCRLWNPDKNDFREKYDFMSVMLTIGLLVARSVILLLWLSSYSFAAVSCRGESVAPSPRNPSSHHLLLLLLLVPWPFEARGELSMASIRLLVLSSSVPLTLASYD